MKISFMKHRSPIIKWVALEVVLLYLIIMGLNARAQEISLVKAISNFFRDLYVGICNNASTLFANEVAIQGKLLTYACYAFGIVAFMVVAIIKIKAVIKQDEKDNGIMIDEKIEEYFDTIMEICERGRLQEARFVWNNSLDSKAGPLLTVQKGGEPPSIMVGPSFIQQMEGIPKQFRLGVAKFLFAHEIVHAKKMDALNLRWILALNLFPFIGILALLWNPMAISLSNNQFLQFGILLVMSLFWILFGSVIVSPSYWAQIREFRADRLALILSGQQASIFKVYVINTHGQRLQKFSLWGKIRNSIKLCWIILFSRDPFKDSIAHPSNERREIELMRDRRWSGLEYFRYGLRQRVNLLMGKGGMI